MNAVLANEWIEGHEHGRIECVLVSRSQVERDDLLALVLRQLIETVRSLEPIASEQNVEVKSVLIARQVVKAIERRAVVSDRMNRVELRRVQETTRSETVRGYEPSCLGSSDTDICLDRRSTE